MGVYRDIKKEQAKLKDASLQKKLEYFWDYHKWHVIAAAAVLAVIASFVVPAVTAKKTVLSGVFLNCYQSSFENIQQELSEEILTALGENPAKSAVELNTGLIYDPDNEESAEINYQSVQRIGAQVTVGDLDFMVGNYEAMLAFAESGTFYALAEVLNPEELAKYEPWVIAQSGGVLLDVSSCSVLMAGYPYLREPLALAIAVNAPHPEQIPELLHYLFGGETPQTT